MSEQRKSSDRRAHYLRRNEALRYPRRLIVFDSEAAVEFNGKVERHGFRCACASVDLIDPETRRPTTSERFETTIASDLWHWVDDWTRANTRTVVFAHNLGYDLRLTNALQLLPALGWELRHFSLDAYRCWARWARGSRGLTMVDTLTYYPASLEKIGGMLKLGKPPLPSPDDGLEAWLRRCRADVTITRAAVLALLDYLESGEHGSWKMTGPAQASASYRHRFLEARQLLVHDHTPALQAERESAYTGRTEAWRHGPQRGWLYEWDYRLAYAHLAERHQVPIRLAGHKFDTNREWLQQASRHYAVLCEVDVETVEPVVPTRTPAGVVWPVGRFSSTLWDIELRLLDLVAGDYTIKHAYLYDRGPALQEWARWIIGALDGPDREPSELQRLMLKSWSRTMIGRFGLRYPELTHVATAPTASLSIVPYWDADEAITRYTIQVGHQVLEQTGAVEGQDSMPAVMAYVMAAGRFELWSTMQAAGLWNVAYVDTDSLLVTADGHERLQRLTRHSTAGNLRYKRRLGRVEILGPRRLLVGGVPRIAGLAGGATRTGPRSWQAEVWESPKGSMRRGRADQVVVELHRFTVTEDDHRRRHLPDGRTEPYLL